MAIYIPVVMQYNDKAAQAAQMSLKKLAAGAGIAAISYQTLGKFAMDAVKAFQDDEKSQRLLATALRNNTQATNEQIAASESFIASTQDTTNVLDDQLRPAYATLIRYTKSTVAAQDLLNGAMDIAAGTGKDLESVATAIGKAYDGNYTALKRLGVPVDDSIIKSKDFSAAWRDLTAAFDGSQEAVTKAEGAVGDLRIAWEDFKEQSGGVVKSVTTGFVQLGAAALEMGNYIAEGVRIGLFGEKQLEEQTKKVTQAAQARVFEEKMNTKWSQIKAEADKKAAEAAKKAAAAAREAAAANKERLASALEYANKKVQEVKDNMASYSKSISDVVSGYVSLSNAVEYSTDKETAYNDALEERRQAYEELAKLQTVVFDAATGKTTVADAEDLANAMERVAKAETAVTTAKGQRKSYSEQFAEQIAAAKSFGESLKTLVDQGLQAAGLQQLLNLGPVAGAQVAKDLLAGTGGLTVRGLNSDLATVASYGDMLGGASAGQVYGGALLAAQAGVTATTMAATNNITIQATSADPDKIVQAIVEWSKRNGKLPSVIKVA